MYYEDAIKQYKRTIKLPKRKLMKASTFELLTISRWTCDEMLSWIKDHRDMAPLEAATQFRLKMEYGAVYSKKNGAFFSTAEDTAQDIIDHIWYSR